MTAVVQETLIAGGGDRDFLTVRHLVLRGSYEDIGEHLGQVARDRYGVAPKLSANAFTTSVRREYMQKHWPQQYSRMAGAARAFDIDILSDEFDLDALDYNPGSTMPGCSCVYYPKDVTSDGHARFSRNFDFTTNVDSFSTKEPYLCEIYPDDGYDHLIMCAYELLGGATDGINSEGLVVALLTDLENSLPVTEPDIPFADPHFEPAVNLATGIAVDTQVGISEIQVVRFLLETCRNVEEAKRALMTVHNYFRWGPLHYIIGDRHGDGFVYEGPQNGVFSKFVDADGKALSVTNHPLHKAHLTNHKAIEESVDRLNQLKTNLANRRELIDVDFVRNNAECVLANLPAEEGQYQAMGDEPSRTLWQGFYDLEERSLCVNYYLHDTGPKEDPTVHRSADLNFVLER